MKLLAKLQEDLKDAMRAHDVTTKETLRMTLAALKNRRIEAGEDLDEGTELQVLTKQVKSDDRRSKKYGKFILEELNRLDRLDVRLHSMGQDFTIEAAVLNSGVTVQIDEAVREFGTKLEKVKITRERIGGGGRIAVTRL